MPDEAGNFELVPAAKHIGEAGDSTFVVPYRYGESAPEVGYRKFLRDIMTAARRERQASLATSFVWGRLLLPRFHKAIEKIVRSFGLAEAVCPPSSVGSLLTCGPTLTLRASTGPTVRQTCKIRPIGLSAWNC